MLITLVLIKSMFLCVLDVLYTNFKKLLLHTFKMVTLLWTRNDWTLHDWTPHDWTPHGWTLHD